MSEETAKDPRDLNGDGKVTLGEKVQYAADKATEKLEQAIEDYKECAKESLKDAKERFSFVCEVDEMPKTVIESLGIK